MLWAAILLNGSTTAAGSITARAFNTTAFATTISGDIGNMCAVQTEISDTRLVCSRWHAVLASLLYGELPPLQQGFYYLSPNFTISELYWEGTVNKVNGGTGSACPDCIQNNDFIASSDNPGMYAMATANGGWRVGFVSLDSTMVEADRAAILVGTAPLSDGCNYFSFHMSATIPPNTE
ncbi:hypothetical protein B0H13DRAFT_2343467 [Mycena leptocephala]|nr:hypothetical protein B0H13DRAFT_2343467 [Mycena leptocephala]